MNRIIILFLLSALLIACKEDAESPDISVFPKVTEENQPEIDLQITDISGDTVNNKIDLLQLVVGGEISSFEDIFFSKRNEMEVSLIIENDSGGVSIDTTFQEKTYGFFDFLIDVEKIPPGKIALKIDTLYIETERELVFTPIWDLPTQAFDFAIDDSLIIEPNQVYELHGFHFGDNPTIKLSGEFKNYFNPVCETLFANDTLIRFKTPTYQPFDYILYMVNDRFKSISMLFQNPFDFSYFSEIFEEKKIVPIWPGEAFLSNGSKLGHINDSITDNFRLFLIDTSNTNFIKEIIDFQRLNNTGDSTLNSIQFDIPEDVPSAFYFSRIENNVFINNGPKFQVFDPPTFESKTPTFQLGDSLNLIYEGSLIPLKELVLYVNEKDNASNGFVQQSPEIAYLVNPESKNLSIQVPTEKLLSLSNIDSIETLEFELILNNSFSKIGAVVQKISIPFRLD